MIGRRLRDAMLTLTVAMLLAVWVVPVAWGFLTSFKTERDVLAYPPKIVFVPTLDNYREVLFGAETILPNLVSSLVVTIATTLLTMLFAIPAAYALARLELPGRTRLRLLRARNADAAAGGAHHSLLPGAAEGRAPRHLRRSHRHLSHLLAALRHLADGVLFRGHPARDGGGGAPRPRRAPADALVRDPAAGEGGIGVTTIFVFLNAWNEFLFAVVLGGNRVRPVTVAMYNFISVEQTLWAKLAAGAMLAMAPVIVLGILAQRHIVKGLTVGAVKGGGRR